MESVCTKILFLSCWVEATPGVVVKLALSSFAWGHTKQFDTCGERWVHHACKGLLNTGAVAVSKPGSPEIQIVLLFFPHRFSPRTHLMVDPDTKWLLTQPLFLGSHTRYSCLCLLEVVKGSEMSEDSLWVAARMELLSLLHRAVFRGMLVCAVSLMRPTEWALDRTPCVTYGLVRQTVNG